MATLNIEIDVPIPVGKMIYVDSVVGNDSTGSRGRFDKPYQTPEAAKAAALAGDLVHVGPGAYAITGNIAKNGVNWYFEQGASVSMVQDGEFGMFDDEDTAMTFSVGGFGEFHMTSASEDFSFVHAITTRNDGTNIKVTGKSVLASTSAGPTFGSDSSGAVAGIKGALEVNFDTIESDGFGYCVYWDNGPMHVNARRIVGWGNGAVVASPLPDAMTGKLWVQADEISCAWDGGSTIAISCQAQNPLAQVWIRALEISRTGTGPAVINQGGKLYVEAQKIVASASESFKSINVGSVPQSWITAQKMTGGSKLVEMIDGTSYIDCPHLEEGPSQTVGVDVQGGTLYLNSQTMTAVNGDGVTISGGVCNISGLTIDTSGSATKNPIVKSGGSLTLNDCTLVAEATQDSISAGTAQTVVSSASKCFQEVNANITVEGDLFYDDGADPSGKVSTGNADGTWSWVAPATGAAWGGITGMLSAQTDLQTALDAKANKSITIRTYTGTTDTLVLADAGNMVRGNNAGANTCTIPPNASVAFPTGTQILFVQRGAGQMTIAAGSGVTVNSFGSALNLVGQYAQAMVTKVGTDEWSIDGNLTS